MKDVTIGALTVGNDRPLLVIAGPCQLESLRPRLQMIAGLDG
jgi:2-dehydro-3-deoxyphosphooctonate aldolase (KDO 8-P synthase)